MTDTQNHLIKLSNPPFKQLWRLDLMLTLNETDVLITYTSSLNSQLKEIWIYNICNDNYTKLINENGVNEIIISYTASLNDNKSFLYLFGESGKIIKLNLKTKQFEISNKSYHDGMGSRSLFINGQFHIFGGLYEEDKYHFIWNENKKELIKIYYFEQIEHELYGHFVHYLKTKNSVLIIPRNCKHIYLYSLSTNKCEIFPIKISKSISFARGVSSGNEQYIIVVGNHTTDIYVFDLKLRKTWKSNIKNDKYMCVSILRDTAKESLLCFGYIRQCWKSSNVLQITFVSNDLIKLIDAYFTFETIYMMNKGNHYCINIDKLLKM